jgi:hypothetical protein
VRLFFCDSPVLFVAQLAVPKGVAANDPGNAISDSGD